MKLLIICFTLLVAALANRLDPQSKCVDELGIDKPILEESYAPIDNPDFHRLTECIWKEEGMMKKNGEINWDAIYRIISVYLESVTSGKSQQEAEAIVKRAIDPCRDVHGDSPGHTAIKVQICIENEMKTVRSESKNQE
ncbi:hypothetical protein ILUMI_10215 [Ignelater luminosus]|uniref:Uncharacterized protein n=1 Tax=Ignelater luminosus TaxID=2038154 RepID=A0A8K0D2T8_IGNLU|nr:hypothetical protein ILUMI_10215 [Ignelater luminosus]